MLDIIYQDESIVVCVKPFRVLSTDEPGGMPDRIREAIGQPQAKVRTVHRLDRPVGGVMVYARTQDAAAKLSAQMQSEAFGKEYLAVLDGAPEPVEGELHDLLFFDRQKGKSYAVRRKRAGVKDARLTYRVLAQAEGLTLVRVRLFTGRTHQIRVQFSHAGYPLAGDAKYGAKEKGSLALCAHHLELKHPRTGKRLSFTVKPEGEIFHSFV